MSMDEFASNLEVQSMESLSLWLERLKPKHRVRVNNIICSFCAELDVQGVQDLKTKALLLCHYQDMGESIIARMISQPRRLNPEERDIVQKHPILSAHIFESKGIENYIGYDLFEEILYHHERWDGQGFFEIRGEEIPILSRFLSPINFYVALTSDRPHREAFSHEEAIDQLHCQSGKRFDPKMVEPVVNVIDNSFATSFNMTSL